MARQIKAPQRLPLDLRKRASVLGVYPRYLVMGSNWTPRDQRPIGRIKRGTARSRAK